MPAPAPPRQGTHPPLFTSAQQPPCGDSPTAPAVHPPVPYECDGRLGGNRTRPLRARPPPTGGSGVRCAVSQETPAAAGIPGPGVSGALGASAACSRNHPRPSAFICGWPCRCRSPAGPLPSCRAGVPTPAGRYPFCHPAGALCSEALAQELCRAGMSTHPRRPLPFRHPAGAERPRDPGPALPTMMSSRAPAKDLVPLPRTRLGRLRPWGGGRIEGGGACPEAKPNGFLPPSKRIHSVAVLICATRRPPSPSRSRSWRSSSL